MLFLSLTLSNRNMQYFTVSVVEQRECSCMNGASPSSQVAVCEINIRDELLCSLEESPPVLQHRLPVHHEECIKTPAAIFFHSEPHVRAMNRLLHSSEDELKTSQGTRK